MHDGVQQLIAGAAFRLEAAANHLTEMPPIVDAQFTAARSALLRAQDGLRDSLTGMLHIDEGPTEFPALLQYAAAAMDHWPKGLVEVHVEGGPPYPLSRLVKGSLLLLMQEAVGNALKHGAAHHVQITLIYHDQEFEMNLEDNGSGFDPLEVPGPKAGHFGLESMRHRMSWLNGSVEILTAPGGGVLVRTRMPRGIAEASKPAEGPQPADVMTTP
jgi:signal transduction histidine kinase